MTEQEPAITGNEIQGLQLSLLEADGKQSGWTSSSWESNTGTESNAPFFSSADVKKSSFSADRSV